MRILKKTKAIQDMDIPKSVSEVQRFLGMVNQLCKFSSNIANLTDSTPSRTAKHKESVVMGALIKTIIIMV